MNRYVLRRQVARVVLLDGRGHVLLLRGRDPSDATKPPWWEIPGGGIDPGETSGQAAARELHEETGIADARMGPVVWTQDAHYIWAGIEFDQTEEIHVAWIDDNGDDREHSPAGLEMLEALAFSGRRWWHPDDLLESDEPVLPYRLREVLPDLAKGLIPDPPVDITHIVPIV
jgi:8-oxo-dGTP pyrophosphatase MutT (NUDIX family)